MRCNHCNGLGRVANPQYPAKARILEDRFDAGYITYDQYENGLNQIFGRGSIPEEYVPCTECIRRSTTLRLKLGAEMGISWAK